MQTAEASLSGAGELARRWTWPALALVLLGGLALRLWGVRQGLPYAYNTDEADHFVPHAVRMFTDGTLNPHYFANPPAFTYVLHYLFALWYGGGAGVRRAFALHPTGVYTLARIAAAVLGTGALWLLYATGARLFGRAVGLLAAAVEAVAFLPVFYAHLALNDVPTLAPLTLSLLGTAGVLRKGRARDYALAGVGLGLACASKYTAGVVLLPLLVAAGLRLLDAAPGAREGAKDSRARQGDAEAGARSRDSDSGAAKRRVVIGLLATGACALAAFLLANPYALLDYHSFHAELVHQSTLSSESQGKLGAPKDGGFAYYLWSLTWGLGWAPALAALGGALLVWRSNRRVGVLLVPATLLFLVFMGLQGRYFGRWLLPVFPLLCLLSAFFVARVIVWMAPRVAQLRLPVPARIALAGALVAALLAQGAIYSIHSGLVLARTDTRTLTRDWMVANIPKGARIVVEPIAPDEWAREVESGASTRGNPYRWRKYPGLLPRVSASGELESQPRAEVGIESYETTLAPALIDYYEAKGYCWVLSGSTQSGRAFADPRAVPHALAYYDALVRRGQVVHRVSPYASGHGPVSFGFDWSFDYYPLAYERPGPQVTIYRLRGGLCAKP